MGKHVSAVKRGGNRRVVYIAAVGLLAISLTAALVIRGLGSKGDGESGLSSRSCEGSTQIQVSATADIQPLLAAAAKSLEAKGGANGAPCAKFTITAAPSAKVAKELASAADGRPDLWVPDSSIWIGRADDGESVPTVAVPSLASSPLVLAGRSENLENTPAWLSSFAGREVALLDPMSQSTGALALLAVQAERAKTAASNTQVAGVLVPLAQRLGAMTKPYVDVEALLGKAAAGGSKVVVPVSEQSVVKYQDEHPGAELKGVIPSTGTLLLDYPLVVTAKPTSEAMAEAGKALAQELLTGDAAKVREDAGFRDPLLSPLSDGRGAGDISRLTAPSARAIDGSLRAWLTLSLPTNSLAVIDVSGSMAAPVPGTGKTRMQLTVEAAATGLKLFPQSSAIGLWTFSNQLDGRRDWKPLVPVRKLTAPQRQDLLGQLSGIKAVVGGGTGLYDTVIAAMQTMQASYQPSAVNTVLLFTDGQGNQDDPGSLTLDQAVQKLRDLSDPARPVRIIALGIGPQASSEELSRLAKATGGQSYVARSPADLQEVFINALQGR
jgi:hypothetical protein